METNEFIIFKKERDVGTMITDTFKFLRTQWKEYFLSVLKIVGPVLLITLIVLIGYFFAMSDIFSNINNTDSPSTFLSSFIPWMGILFLVYIVLYTLLSMTSLYFIKSYIETKGKPVYHEIKTQVWRNFWKFLGLGFLVGISVFAGAILCYLPGIYLWVILSLGFAIMVFENRSAGDSYSHSFTLIKGEWWNTFGVKLLVGLLVGILAQAFAIPALIYQMIYMSTHTAGDPTEVFSMFKDPIYLALNVLSYAFQFILSSVSLIAGAFIYFDLNEQKNLSGTIELIDSLGNSE